MRNKTIAFPLEEAEPYLSQALTEKDVVKGGFKLNACVLGDTFKVLRALKDEGITKVFDLMIVDPPYNLNKKFGGEAFSAMTKSEYVAYTDEWLSLCMPLLKDDASVYVCCDWKCSNEIAEVLSKYCIIRNRITWQREKGRGAKKNWKNGMEDVWFATVSEEYKFNLNAVKQRRRVLAPYKQDGVPKDWKETPDGKYRDTCPSNFWDDISVPYWSMAENTAHPTQKPEKLIAKLILASSNEGDAVLDVFGGSLTTAVTAKKLKRSFFTIEKDRSYLAWGIKRLNDADNDKTIQGYEDGVFWERNSLLKKQKNR